MSDPPRIEFPAPAPIDERPVADVHVPAQGTGSQVTYTFPIRQPEEDLKDFQIGIRASLLRRSRTRLTSLTTQSFPFAEVLLGVSTLTAGGSLSALLSDIKVESWRGALFFLILPLIAVGCGVAYGMLRYYGLRAVHQIASDILDDLADPERAVDVGDK